ncbi:MAG: HAD-IIIC family phosphatase [bacterium]
MKLGEALQVLSNVGAQTPVFPVCLASGFTPLHLATLLSAELQRQLPGRRVKLETGLFGDLCGTIRRVAEGSYEAVCVQVEWADLDARLGLRQSGSWDVDALPDVLSTCCMTLRALEECIGPAASRMPVVVSVPTLPIPPVSHEAGAQAGLFELQLRAAIAGWQARLCALPGVRMVRSQAVDVVSAHGERFDVQSELHFGFPYSMSHAGALAAVLAALVVPPAPKKGLITDLDDTLWKGTLGEAGADGINWDLDHGSQIHGVYQRLLNSLASAGVLIGVATRNEAAGVQKAFERADMILDRKRVYPIEAGWGPKSPLVRRILDAWNIRADDVVFVDNMAAEIGEVQLAYPGIAGVLFPEHAQDVAAMMERLRDLFGKEHVTHEDALRIGSLRGGEVFREEAAKSGIPPSCSCRRPRQS